MNRLLFLFLILITRTNSSSIRTWNPHSRSPNDGLCAQLIIPNGYPCTEHTVQTEDGFLLALQRVSSPKRGGISVEKFGPPVLLQHGLFMAGDVWFLNSMEDSLGFVLADRGFDVWVGNVRGTHWSHGHISFSEKDKEFWEWSWQELASYDLAGMVNYVHSLTNKKVLFVGHSQGSIMGLAAFTQPDIANMVESAAFLSPISYLGHIKSLFVRRLVALHLDKMIVDMGFHQLNFRSDFGVYMLDFICAGHMDCNDLLSAVTGKNCCFNNSRVDFYLDYEPHPSSSKNLNHLFQMIRKGKFAEYDYGLLGNLRRYGQLEPPVFSLANIPTSLPLWMGYGGSDALSDITDLEHTMKELKLKPDLLYLESYGHVDFILSVKAKEDVYNQMIGFFQSKGKLSSSI